jgi:hypothetical protein
LTSGLTQTAPARPPAAHVPTRYDDALRRASPSFRGTSTTLVINRDNVDGGESIVYGPDKRTEYLRHLARRTGDLPGRRRLCAVALGDPDTRSRPRQLA